jgi:hypothetical protein
MEDEMIRIRAIAEAQVWQRYSGDRESEQVTDPQRLAYFSGLEYRRESFAEYFTDGPDSTRLAELEITGGYIRLEFSPETNGLIGVTEYTSPSRLDDTDLALLARYTAGQWSDGVGSNFSQSMAVAARISVDLWPVSESFISQSEG